eukprot:jgi/Galph1/727/GphlegSOOS_G5447.1
MSTVDTRNTPSSKEQELKNYLEYLQNHALQLETELAHVRQAIAQVSFHLRSCRETSLSRSPNGCSNVSAVTGESVENTCLSRNLSYSSFDSLTARSDTTIQGAKVGEKRRRVAKGYSGRYWSHEEHEKFLQALKLFGQHNLKAVSSYVGTRTAVQCRTHLQKYLLRLQRESQRNQMKQNNETAPELQENPKESNTRPWEEIRTCKIEEKQIPCNLEKVSVNEQKKQSSAVLGGVHLLCIAAQEVSAR